MRVATLLAISLCVVGFVSYVGAEGMAEESEHVKALRDTIKTLQEVRKSVERVGRSLKRKPIEMVKQRYVS